MSENTNDKASAEGQTYTPDVGSVSNGVATVQSKCIGCGDAFEDFYMVGESPDPLPVCGGCAATMEP